MTKYGTAIFTLIRRAVFLDPDDDHWQAVTVA